MGLYFNVLMEKMMKKVCFIFAIFAAIFFMVACGSDDIKNALNDEENNTSDTVEDPDNSTNNGDENDPNNQNDPNDPNNQNDPNDPNNQNDPNDPNNQNDPNDPNNQNDPNDPNNQNDPNDPNNQNDPNDPNNQNDPNDPNNQNDPNDPNDPNNPDNPDNPNVDPTVDPVVDPCNPNKCLEDDHSDGVCTAAEAGSEELFTCGCVSDILGNYTWYDGKCRQVVTKHQCQQLAEFVQATFGVPDWVTNVVEFVCHCFTDECVIIWEP